MVRYLVENSLKSEIDTCKKSIEAIKVLVDSNNSSSIERDNALETRVANIESALVVGVMFKGVVDTFDDLANLNGDETKNGWAYRVKNGENGSDIYVVIGSSDGDFKPDGWLINLLCTLWTLLMLQMR